MSITIELSPEKERLLAQAAARNGVGASEYARGLVENGLPERVQSVLTADQERPRQNSASDPTIALLETWNREDAEWLAKATPEEIDLERAEWDEIMKNISENRFSLPIPEIGSFD